MATGYTGAVHFTSSDTRASLPPDYTFTAANGGTHSFTVTLRSTGAQTVTVTDKTTRSITGGTTVTVSRGG